MDEAPRHAIWLDRLKETVDAAVESNRDQLPPTPHFEWAERAKWTMWQLKPEPTDDFPGQADQFVGKSLNPAMWIAAHSGGPFDSERFTRCGETFCYLKVDRAEGLDESEFADKSDIEDAVDEALMSRGLGCQIGGGMGLRYGSRSRRGLLAQDRLIITAAWTGRLRSHNTSGTASRTMLAPSWGPSSTALSGRSPS